MKKYLILSLLLASNLSFASLSDYAKKVGTTEVVYTHSDGFSYVAINIMPPVVAINSTKDYAQYVMDSFQGFELNAQLSLRGYSFKYVDNAPCAGVLSYFDGVNYLLFRSCGVNKEKDIKAIYKEAYVSLKLDDMLEKSSKAALY